MAVIHPQLPQAERALRDAFGDDVAIFPKDGFEKRLVLKIISPQFNGRTEKEKQTMVWDCLRSALGSAASEIGIVIIYGTDEL